MHKAKAAFIIPLPNINATTTESKITGIEKIVSITIVRHLSNRPPKYPLINPKGKPRTNAKKVARKTTSKAIEEPCKVLKQTSLPSLSVPHKCLKEGGAKISLLNDETEYPKKLFASKNFTIKTTRR